jgi:hypothetical protein
MPPHSLSRQVMLSSAKHKALSPFSFLSRLPDYINTNAFNFFVFMDCEIETFHFGDLGGGYRLLRKNPCFQQKPVEATDFPADLC